MSRPVKVLVVDDSPIACRILAKELSRDGRLQVVGTAEDAYKARNMILTTKPDVLTLDIEMPRMNGLDFIQVLMKHHPIPIVVVSSLTGDNSETAIRALELGAVDVFGKPGSKTSLRQSFQTAQLIDKVISACHARVGFNVRRQPVKRIERLRGMADASRVIAIGASTGGPEAIKCVLEAMPANTPGILIVQHMPKDFTRAFAERLDGICMQLKVSEAQGGEVLEPGMVLIAPGDKHLLLRKKNGQFVALIKNGPSVCRHRPSVEVLFNTVAEVAGSNAVGVLLTGMGKDGAQSLLKMRQAGAHTIAQDEESSVVFGMPREAIQLKAAERVVPLSNIPQLIYRLSKENRS